MNAIKIFHTGDWHLRDNDIAECRKCLTHIVKRAEEIKPDVAVIAGDIFDNRNVKLDSESARLCFEAVSIMADTCPVAVLIGTPSHDGLAAELLSHVGARNQVRVSSRPEQIFVGEHVFSPLFCDGYKVAAITMIPTPTKQYWQSESDIKGTDAEIAEAMTGVLAGFGAETEQFPGVPHILVGHFSVGGAQLSETQYMIGRDIEISRDQLALAKADVVCLGHIHKAQKINPNIYYCGSLYRKDYGEMDPKGFFVHEIATGTERRIETSWVDTPSRYLYRIGRDLTRQENPDFAIKPKLEEVEAVTNAKLRIEVKVWQDEADRLDVVSISDQYLKLGAEDVKIRINRVPRAQVRSDKMFSLQSLRDKVAERARLNGHAVTEGILGKADLLENESAEGIFESLKRQSCGGGI